MTPSHLHWPAEQTFAVHEEVETYTEDDGDLEDVFALVTVPPGTIGDPRNRPLHRPYRCSRWHVIWDTRCARSPNKRTPPTTSRKSIVLRSESWFPPSDTNRSGLFQNQVFQLWTVWTHADPLSTTGHVPTIQTCGLATPI